MQVAHVWQRGEASQEKWKKDSCGIACVRMILLQRYIAVCSLDELIQDGLERGGFSKRGWRHDTLIELLKKRGVKARREEYKDKPFDLGYSHIRKNLRMGKPVMASVNTPKGYHIILLTEATMNGLRYNDPAHEHGQDMIMTSSEFFKIWRRLCILVD